MKEILKNIVKSPKTSGIGLLIAVVMVALIYFGLIDLNKLEDSIGAIGGSTIVLLLLGLKDPKEKKDA